jgi:hypothetical protein
VFLYASWLAERLKQKATAIGNAQPIFPRLCSHIFFLEAWVIILACLAL